jgi:hypothetical protein
LSDNGNGQKPAGNRVFFSVLMERTIPEIGAGAMMDVSMVCGVNGFTRIQVPYMRVDWARNVIARAFCDGTKEPNDVLVMLDCDHKHPADIVMRLAAHEPAMGVVGALAFRRGPPYEPMMFLKSDSGVFRSPAEWAAGTCYKIDAMGMAAIAIRRWVFDKLTESGYPFPWFRFEYPAYCGFNKSEDIYFCETCGAAGIDMFCNTAIVSPHIGTYMIDDKTWFQENKDRTPATPFEQGIHDRESVPEQFQNPGVTQREIKFPEIVTKVNA